MLTFAQAHIGERAAVPKEIIILDKLPLTAVGKLYKPALSFAQIEQVFGAELQALTGIAQSKIQVESDKRLGTVAHVTVTCATGVDKAELQTQVKAALGKYAVRSAVTVR